MDTENDRMTDEMLEVAVIGAGFGGICTAKRLLDEGTTNFLVFDRATEVGGTWHANTYPGAQCDIPAALYSFSFAQKPDWSRLYPLQPELLSYLREVCETFGIEPHLRLGHEILHMRWDETGQHWTLATSEGTWRARVVVGAFGPFSEPSTPKFEGLEDFEGTVLHSARWDHTKDWRGKRIGVIGTGASGVQIIPQAVRAGSSLTVFQRTPTWIFPHPDQPTPSALQNLFARVPATQRALRRTVDVVLESMVYGLVFRPAMLKGMEAIAKAHLRRQVPNPELREKLTPDYMFGCKRPTFSNAYFPAMADAKTDVITEPIRRIVPTGVETADGTVHELDVLVLATGFTVSGHPFFSRVHDAGGRSLAESWEPTPLCYLGTAAAGFPNLFQILGPNAATYTSMVIVIEAQVDYIISALREMKANGLTSLEVRGDAVERFVDEIDTTLSRSVWNVGGCASYYIDATGRNIAWFPGFFRQFRARTRRIHLPDFVLGAGGDDPEDTSAGSAGSADTEEASWP